MHGARAHRHRALVTRRRPRANAMGAKSFDDMFACTPASLTKLRGRAHARATPRSDGARDYSPVAFPNVREGAEIADAFGDMFLASPASLKKMRSSASGGFGSPVACVVAERGEARGAAAAAKETMSVSEMFTSSPADLAKMRRSNVGGSERGNSIVAPEVRGDGRARVEARAWAGQ